MHKLLIQYNLLYQSVFSPPLQKKNSLDAEILLRSMGREASAVPGSTSSYNHTMMKHYDVRVAVDKSKLCVWVSTWQGNWWPSGQAFNNIWQVFGQSDDLIHRSPRWFGNLLFLCAHMTHSFPVSPDPGLFFKHTFFTFDSGCCFLIYCKILYMHVFLKSVFVVFNPSSDNLYQMASQLECMGWNPVNSLASTIKR